MSHPLIIMCKYTPFVSLHYNYDSCITFKVEKGGGKCQPCMCSIYEMTISSRLPCVLCTNLEVLTLLLTASVSFLYRRCQSHLFTIMGGVSQYLWIALWVVPVLSISVPVDCTMGGASISADKI